MFNQILRIMNGKEVRESFWATLKEEMTNGRKFSATDIRCAFCDYVDHLEKGGQISEDLARCITL